MLFLIILAGCCLVGLLSALSAVEQVETYNERYLRELAARSNRSRPRTRRQR